MKDNEASSTAYTVLQGLLYISSKPEFSALVSDDVKKIGRHIMQSSAEGIKRLKQLKNPFFLAALPFAERLMLPKITLHYLLRKTYIEQQVREAITHGATQVINLGAGFDTLLYRLAKENPNLNCIEIDHPATHAVKKSALQHPKVKKTNLSFLPVDFTTQTLAEELGAFSAFDPNRETVCVVEGVLMYLTQEQVYDLLGSLVNLLQVPKRHLVFTAVEPPSVHPSSYGPLLKLYLALKREPLNWECKEQELCDFMKKSDFELQETANGDDFKQRYIPNYKGALHRGEYGATARSTTA